MNPMMGEIRNRANAGMTTPAQPRMTSASLNPPDDETGAIAP